MIDIGTWKKLRKSDGRGINGGWICHHKYGRGNAIDI